MIVEVDFPDHWKTRMLVDLLEGDEAAPVYLLRLWAHCQVRKQWVFDNLPPAALRALCRFPGHANKLESSLVASGFVRRDDAGVVTVCSWDEYNASLIANWENGAKGGRPKKPKPNPPKTHGLAMANPNETDREEVIEGIEKKHTTTPQASGYLLDPEEFLAVWNSYHPHTKRAGPTAANLPMQDRILQLLNDPCWVETYRQALDKLPLAYHVHDPSISIKWFLDPDRVALILSGEYDTPPRDSGRRTPAKPTAASAQATVSETLKKLRAEREKGTQ